MNTDPIIRTHSGLLVNLLDPDPSKITIGDIAHSLSHINRFGGHTPQPYSVAEHSILVASTFHDPRDYRTALLHDASETYLGDMLGPLKHTHVGIDFRILESMWEEEIAAKFDLWYPNEGEPAETVCRQVKELDHAIVEWEKVFVVRNPLRVAPRPIDVKFQFITLARTKGELRG